MKHSTLHPETNAIHSGRDSKKTGIVNSPIYQSSTIVFKDYAEFKAADTGSYSGIGVAEPREKSYGRIGTETTFDAESTIASLYGDGKLCKMTSSGYSALVIAISAFLKSGDHVLVCDGLYSPTRKFFTNFLARFGVQVDFYDPIISAEKLSGMILQNTKVIFMESPISLTFEIIDVPAVAKLCKEKNIISIIDNTWSTPIFFNPFDYGVDVVVESCTKFLGGHSDVFAGSITVLPKHFDAIVRSHRDIGANVTPITAYTIARGIRTLYNRIMAQMPNVALIMEHLLQNSKVLEILHPTQENCPGHDVFKKYHKGFSSLFTMRLKKKYSSEEIAKFFDSLELFNMGYSWGGFESLTIEFPDKLLRTASERTYSDTTNIRIYIGLENPLDLLQDITQALDQIS